MRIPDNSNIVIFGASGDLTFRMLIPALYHLFASGQLPDTFFILGVSRTEFTDITYRKALVGALSDIEGVDNERLEQFCEHIYYQALNRLNFIQKHIQFVDVRRFGYVKNFIISIFNFLNIKIHKYIKYIADISYPMYAIHVIGYPLLSFFCYKLGLMGGAALVVTVTILCFMSHLIHKLIENPSIQIGRNFYSGVQ